MISREALHEAGHVLGGQWMGAELLDAHVDRVCGGAGSTRSLPPPGATTAEDLERAALAHALYTASGLAAEQLLARGPVDETRCASDLVALQNTYDEYRTYWAPWAKDFERFKDVVACVGEQALREERELLLNIANLLKSRNGLSQHDITPLGRITKWMAPGSDWRPAFWGLVRRANQTLTAHVQALDESRAFDARYHRLCAQIAARR
jgi:hypothetical protein